MAPGFFVDAVFSRGPAFGEVAIVGLPVVLQLTAKRRTELRNDNSSDRMIRWTRSRFSGVGKLEWKIKRVPRRRSTSKLAVSRDSVSPVGTQCL